MPPPASVPESWSKGEEVTPPPAIEPEWSAWRRECSRKLFDPMSWPGGEEVIPLPILKKIDRENERTFLRSKPCFPFASTSDF